ncbi:MAG: hypothetical protein ACFFC7_01835 [Candidatus Hermodarchaeota archaeon]
MIFLSSYNELSKRYGVFEEDEIVGWLYLTAPNSEQPVADVFVYTLTEPISEASVDRLKSENGRGPPPLSREYANELSVRTNVTEDDLSFEWSRDGESICLLIHTRPVAMIIKNKKRGYSVGLAYSGPYGEPWNAELFRLTFT